LEELENHENKQYPEHQSGRVIRIPVNVAIPRQRLHVNHPECFRPDKKTKVPVLSSQFRYQQFSQEQQTTDDLNNREQIANVTEVRRHACYWKRSKSNIGSSERRRNPDKSYRNLGWQGTSKSFSIAAAGETDTTPARSDDGVASGR
jgi:hypothetical protein